MTYVEKSSSRHALAQVGTLLLIVAGIPIAMYAFNLLNWPETLAIPLAFGAMVLVSGPMLLIPYLAKSFFLDSRVRLGLFYLVVSILTTACFQGFIFAEWAAGVASHDHLWRWFGKEVLVISSLGTIVTMFACGMRSTYENQEQTLHHSAWFSLFLMLTATIFTLLLASFTDIFVIQPVTILAMCSFTLLLNASLSLRVAVYQRSLLLGSLTFAQACLGLATALSCLNFRTEQFGEILLLHNISLLFANLLLTISVVLQLRSNGISYPDEQTQNLPTQQDSQFLIEKFRDHFAPVLLQLVAKSEEALMTTAPHIPSGQLYSLYELNQMSWRLLQNIDELDHFLARSLGRTPSDIKTISVHNLMQQMHRIAQRIADQHFVMVETFYPEHLGDIDLDVNHFLQACLPILRNAIHYTQNAKVSLHLYPIKRTGRAYLRLDIRDAGRGFASSDFQKIQNLFQLPQQELLATQPLALASGIPLAYHLCQEMQTELTMESRMGVGTTFSLTWADSLADRRKNRELTPDMSYRKALLFSHNSQFLTELQNPIEEQGFDLYTTQNLGSSLRLVIEQQPAILLVELSEDNSAFDFLETLQEYSMQTHVIGLIADRDRHLSERAKATGARWVLGSQEIAEQIPSILEARILSSRTA